MNNYHKSVLLHEAVEGLNVQKDKLYIDTTLGGGGHTGEIIKKGGIVLGIDTDEDALRYVGENYKEEIKGKKLKLAKGNFKDIDIIAKENGFEKVSGIIFDLGVSSHQLDVAERGFSFQKTGPLDMRMDQEQGVKAADLINILTKGELYELFTKLGEERFANAISDRIISRRKISPINTTTDLVEVVRHAVPKYRHNINPATRIFQALRIAINDEINNLRDSLPKAFDLLEGNGRLCVISFHSLEDRVVKYQFKEWNEAGRGVNITKKPIAPSIEEIEMNKRSRSSKLRIIERI